MATILFDKTQYGVEWSKVIKDPAPTLPEVNAFSTQHPKKHSNTPIIHVPETTSKAPTAKPGTVIPNSQTHNLKVNKPKKEKVPKTIVMKQDGDVETPPVDVPSDSTIGTMFVKLNQSGYQTNTKFERYSSGDYSVPKMVVPMNPLVGISNEAVNEFKFRYRSGRQPQGDKHTPVDEKFCLMDSTNLVKIKPGRTVGNLNSSNGHNGNIGIKIRELHYSMDV